MASFICQLGNQKESLFLCRHSGAVREQSVRHTHFTLKEENKTTHQKRSTLQWHLCPVYTIHTKVDIQCTPLLLFPAMVEVLVRRKMSKSIINLSDNDPIDRQFLQLV